MRNILVALAIILPASSGGAFLYQNIMKSNTNDFERNLPAMSDSLIVDERRESQENHHIVEVTPTGQINIVEVSNAQ